MNMDSAISILIHNLNFVNRSPGEFNYQCFENDSYVLRATIDGWELQLKSGQETIMIASLQQIINFLGGKKYMTKTITIDGEDYVVNVDAAVKAGLLKKAVTHTTGDFYKDETGAIYMLTIWEHVAYLLAVNGEDAGRVYNYRKADSEVLSDQEFKSFVHGQKFIKIKCTLNEA